jgi:hypothetical protein
MKAHSFKPGQRVVCIDDRFPIQAKDWGTNFPVMGSVYTVHSIHDTRNGITGKPGRGIKLVELLGPLEKINFAMQRFVPVGDSGSIVECIRVEHSGNRQPHHTPTPTGISQSIGGPLSSAVEP